MFGLFKKKPVIEKVTKKIKTNNATVHVFYGDNEYGTITKTGHIYYRGDIPYMTSGKYLLDSYLENVNNFIELDNGLRIPISSIKRFDPVTTIEIEVEV
jgi:hypothetical protein